jgi:hypothetical protein
MSINDNELSKQPTYQATKQKFSTYGVGIQKMGRGVHADGLHLLKSFFFKFKGTLFAFQFQRIFVVFNLRSDCKIKKIC